MASARPLLLLALVAGAALVAVSQIVESDRRAAVPPRCPECGARLLHRPAAEDLPDSPSGYLDGVTDRTSPRRAPDWR